MPRFYTDDLDIEVDEFMEELGDADIEEVIQWLRDTNHINDIDIIQEPQLSPLDNEYMSIVSKLNSPLVGARLSNEDIAILKQIADKI
jgi:hypothetical protein